ncbi:MAG: hypothetical protein ACI9W4_003040 [Rhodothermales bacterium]|jgi:hypothetical protein
MASTTGTVRKVDLEGGFFGIVTDAGLDLFPLNLAVDHRKDGTRLRFSHEAAAVFTLHQWGSPVTLSDVQPVP